MISIKNMDTYSLLNYSDYLENVSCLAVMNFHFSYRCEMAKKIENCRYITNFFNYFVLMYCTFKIDNKITEIVVMLLFGLIYCFFLCILYLGINHYFLPTLKIAALRLRINEYMAGVVLVGVANSTPDLLVNLSPVRQESLTFNIAMASALTIICLSGGAVCFIRPFRMNGHSIFRDLLFLLLTIELVRLLINIKHITALVKGILVLTIYPIYLLINVADILLQRFTINKLRKEIEILRHSPSSQQHDLRLADKIILLNGFEEDEDIQIRESKLLRQKTFQAGFFVTPKQLSRHKEVDVEANRTILHNKANPKNLFLFSEFFRSINPIDPEQWYLSGKCARIALVAKVPVTFMLQLLIPFVDFQKVKHGWSKLLNCIQIVLTPFVLVTLVETMFARNYFNWHNIIQVNFSVWSLMVTLPLAIIVFWHSRTDIPPWYHSVYSLLTISTVIIFCWICAWEMDALISIIGIVFNLSPSYMSITFNAVSAATADFISYGHLAQHGYGKMAFGAVVGGSVFNMVVNVGIEFVMQKKVDSHGQVVLFGGEGETIYIFLVLTITTTMWWCLTFNFLARRSAGVFLWCLFILFLIYSTAIEFEWVHGFEDNPHIHPVAE
ncbi:mitochondrial sodium/calcium exchanger protein [Drosophila rhopaloa]|uniref:Sodium/potassium/calcium exchanger 6, mitochondrial n=1 Tax=Drosophila rhopaloa TaxID=1041015 RepID=A0A6P4F7R6_DRORH|nr:mitochondrial sodium/calcium exchanger protein [Drosophila rhopaloa]